MCASGSRANSTRHRAAPYPNEEEPGHGHPRSGAARVPPQHREEDEPLEGRLVELARMTRLGTGAGKDHRPRKVRRLAPELAVDEVRDAAEPEPGRYERNEEIGYHEEPEPVPAGKPRRGRDHPEEPSVEGHPSLPDPQDDQGIGDETREVVEQYVADASPQHRAEREVEHDVVDVPRGPSPPRVPRRAAPAEPPPEPDADDVGDAVPADRHRPDGYCDRVDLGKVEHDRRAGSAGQAAASPENLDDSRFPPAHRGMPGPGRAPG